MFEITENTQDPSSRQAMPFGINENVKLTEVTFESLKEGNDPVLIYKFEDAQGRGVRKVMWEPDPERIRENAVTYPRQHGRDNKQLGYVKGETIKPDEAVQIAYADFSAYNKHILNRYFTPEQVVEGTKGSKTYADFAQNVIKLVESLDETPLVRVIIVPNNSGYAELPKNHYNPFIERMDVNPSGLKITPYMQQQIDQFSKPSNPEGFDSGSPFEEDAAADF